MNNRENAMLEKVPYAPLGIIAMDGSTELGNKIDSYIVDWRNTYVDEHVDKVTFPSYLRDSFLIDACVPRFKTGDGKGAIRETVRGYDLFILSDCYNYSCNYNMYDFQNAKSPDDHFRDIKRIIAAAGGKAGRITVIMPMLYSGRQHRKVARESLDCALALQELETLGVENIITFDAHDPRVQNAVPLIGFESIEPSYQFIKALFKSEKDLKVDKDHLVVISPDEGAISRCIYYSSILEIDLGVFYKRRDYSRLVNGKNPIISHEYLGDSVEGKDVIVVDDILASGESALDIALELKRRKANRIYILVSFAQFTNGLDEFNKAYEDGIITKVFGTNLTYRRPELLQTPWYVDVDMSKFLAYLIDTINHNMSLSSLLDPSEKIRSILKKYKSKS